VVIRRVVVPHLFRYRRFNQMKKLRTGLLGSVFWLAAHGAEWPEFRGPDAQGVVEAKGVPVGLDLENGYLWKALIPGKGWSSPVMKDGLIVVTTSVKTDQVELLVIALDAKTGKPIWTRSVFQPTVDEAGTIHEKNSLASSSPLIVGDTVFAHFGHMGTAALSLQTGEIRWKYHNTYASQHGNGGSPILVDGILIFSADGEDEGLLRGLNAETGKLKWEINREREVRQKFSFGTPLAVDVEGEKVVVSQGSGMVGGYRPSDGRLLWWVDYGSGFSVVPRPVHHDGVVYVTTGFNVAKLLAIQLKGAKGDVTKTHVKWTAKRDIPKTPSFVMSGKEIYLVDDTGRMSCLDCETGERVWREQLQRKVSCSLTLVGDKLYTFSEEGQGFVHEVSRKGAKELAVNEFKEPIFASPIVFENTLIVRSEKALWRFGKGE
jgi:outer membrane protein assembly factor BamB